MSNPTENIAPIELVSEKQSIVRKGLNFVKNHKKTVIATVGLAVLVGASAYVGGTIAAPEELENDAVQAESDSVA